MSKTESQAQATHQHQDTANKASGRSFSGRLQQYLETVDISEGTWRKRTLRYLTLYVILVTALVSVRYLTHTIRPTLRATERQAAELTMQRDRLQIQLQALTTPQRIQTWANNNNMIRFAEAAKVPLDLSKATIAQPTLPSLTPSFGISTKWRD